MRGDLSLEELLQMAIQAQLAGLNVSIAGKIESYDASKQRADVRPMVKRAVQTPDEDFLFEDLPVIPNVRVLMPGGNSWQVHIPLNVGDEVALVFQQWDPSNFERTGGLSQPADKRAFSLAHAYAIPGYRSDANPMIATNENDITFRHSSGFTVAMKANGTAEIGNAPVVDAAALASKVNTELQAMVTAFNTHTHPYFPGPGATAPTSVPTVPKPAPSPVDSMVLKVSG